MCMQYLSWNRLRLLHVMDTYSRYSAAFDVRDARFHQQYWLSNLHLWHNYSLLILCGETKRFASKNSRNKFRKAFWDVPYQKNEEHALKPSCGVISSVFLRLKSTFSEANSAFLPSWQMELQWRFMDLTQPQPLNWQRVSSDLMMLVVRWNQCHRKLSLPGKIYLLSRANLDYAIKIYFSSDIESRGLGGLICSIWTKKMGKWLSSRVVLQPYVRAGTTIGPGPGGWTIRALIKDKRASDTEDDVARMLQVSLDALGNALDETIYSILSNHSVKTQSKPQQNNMDSSSEFQAESNSLGNGTMLLSEGDQVEIL